MTPARRAEIEALCREATPGPWINNSPHCRETSVFQAQEDGSYIASTLHCGPQGLKQNIADAAFIAAARTALPEALAEVDRLTARWEALKEGVSKVHQHWASFHSVAPSAVAEVQTLIDLLERLP